MQTVLTLLLCTDISHGEGGMEATCLYTLLSIHLTVMWYKKQHLTVKYHESLTSV
jgi:hypothetical protein